MSEDEDDIQSLDRTQRDIPPNRMIVILDDFAPFSLSKVLSANLTLIRDCKPIALDDCKVQPLYEIKDHPALTTVKIREKERRTAFLDSIRNKRPRRHR